MAIKQQAFGGNNTTGPIDVATAVRAKGGAGHMDFESETFVTQEIASTLDASYGRLQGCSGQDANHGHSHLVAVPIQEVGKRTGASTDDPRAGIGIGNADDPMYTLQSGAQHGVAVAFSCKDHGADAGEIAPTLRAMQHDGSHANAGGQVAVAFKACGQDGFSPAQVCPPITSTDGGGAGVPTAQAGLAVRRLTPTECERLQGFPDGFTAVDYRGKPAADGPRYRALGNSMAVPVMRFILDRLQETTHAR